MKVISEVKNELKEFIPQGIDVTFQALKNVLATGTDAYHDLLLLEGRYQDVLRQLVQGVIDDEKAQLHFNIIRKDLLTFIDEIRENHLARAEGTGENGRPDVYNGEVLYRIPKKMRMEEEVKCMIRLAFDRKLLVSELEVQAGDVMKDIRISDVMGVELMDPSGAAFQIRTLHDTVQFIEKDLYTEWVFYVKPVSEGLHPLVLKISIIEMREGIERKRNIVLEETIEILANEQEIRLPEAFIQTGISLKVPGNQWPLEIPGAIKFTDQPIIPPYAPQPSPPGAEVVPKARKKGSAGRKIASALAGLAVLLTAAWVVIMNGIIDPMKDVALSEAEQEWKMVTEDPSRERYEAFVRKYPDDKLAKVARIRLDSIELDHWESAIATRDEGRIRDYLERYPAGKFVPEARKRIFELERENGGTVKDSTESVDPRFINPGNPAGKNEIIREPSDIPALENRPRIQAETQPDVTRVQGSGSNNDRPIPMSDAARLPVYRGCEHTDSMKEKECTEKSMAKYIRDHLIYPVEAKRRGLEGAVEVTFIVEKDGQVSEVKVEKDIGGGCAREAVRLVRELPTFIPGTDQKGNPARIIYRLPVRFKLK